MDSSSRHVAYPLEGLLELVREEARCGGTVGNPPLFHPVGLALSLFTDSQLHALPVARR